MLHNKGRSKKIATEESEGADDSGEWIMSYADTVTLLLCFFIIFFAQQKKESDNEFLIKLSQELEEKEKGTANQREAQSERQSQMLSKVEKSVRAGLAGEKSKKNYLGIEKREKELLIRINEKGFFHLGSYRLTEKGVGVLEKVAELLKPYQNNLLVRIEGHSDSLQVNPLAKNYTTNLNLSSLRASQAADVLIANGFFEDRIRVAGYGAAQLLVQDRMPASQGSEYIPEKGLINRRVEIRVLIKDAGADKEMKLLFDK